MGAADVTDEGVLRLQEEMKETLLRMEEQIRALLREGRRGFTVEAQQRILTGLLDEYERLFGQAERALLGIGADVLEAVGDELVQAGLVDQLTTPSEALLRAQAGDTIDQLSTLKGERRASLRAAIVEMARSTVPPDEAVAALMSEARLTASQALTEVDTGVAGLDRTAVVAMAEEAGDFLYLYDGPVDSLTREWCREHAGYLHTRAEMDEQSNDTGPQPPSTYGGGYGCRHRWSPVAREDWGRYPRWQGRALPAPALPAAQALAA